MPYAQNSESSGRSPSPDSFASLPSLRAPVGPVGPAAPRGVHAAANLTAELAELEAITKRSALAPSPMISPRSRGSAEASPASIPQVNVSSPRSRGSTSSSSAAVASPRGPASLAPMAAFRGSQQQPAAAASQRADSIATTRSHRSSSFDGLNSMVDSDDEKEPSAMLKPAAPKATPSDDEGDGTMFGAAAARALRMQSIQTTQPRSTLPTRTSSSSSLTGTRPSAAGDSELVRKPSGSSLTGSPASSPPQPAPTRKPSASSLTSSQLSTAAPAGRGSARAPSTSGESIHSGSSHSELGSVPLSLRVKERATSTVTISSTSTKDTAAAASTVAVVPEGDGDADAEGDGKGAEGAGKSAEPRKRGGLRKRQSLTRRRVTINEEAAQAAAVKPASRALLEVPSGARGASGARRASATEMMSREVGADDSDEEEQDSARPADAAQQQQRLKLGEVATRDIHDNRRDHQHESAALHATSVFKLDMALHGVGHAGRAEFGDAATPAESEAKTTNSEALAVRTKKHITSELFLSRSRMLVQQPQLLMLYSFKRKRSDVFLSWVTSDLKLVFEPVSGACRTLRRKVFDIRSFRWVVYGVFTTNFKAHAKRKALTYPWRCFSLVSPAITLDCQAETDSISTHWVAALQDALKVEMESALRPALSVMELLLKRTTLKIQLEAFHYGMHWGQLLVKKLENAPPFEEAPESPETPTPQRRGSSSSDSPLLRRNSSSGDTSLRKVASTNSATLRRVDSTGSAASNASNAPGVLKGVSRHEVTGSRSGNPLELARASSQRSLTANAAAAGSPRGSSGSLGTAAALNSSGVHIDVDLDALDTALGANAVADVGDADGSAAGLRRVNSDGSQASGDSLARRSSAFHPKQEPSAVSSMRRTLSSRKVVFKDGQNPSSPTDPSSPPAGVRLKFNMDSVRDEIERSIEKGAGDEAVTAANLARFMRQPPSRLVARALRMAVAMPFIVQRYDVRGKRVDLFTLQLSTALDTINFGPVDAKKVKDIAWRQIAVPSIAWVIYGPYTKTFKAHKTIGTEWRCLSLVLTNKESIDLEAGSDDEAQTLVLALQWIAREQMMMQGRRLMSYTKLVFKRAIFKLMGEARDKSTHWGQLLARKLHERHNEEEWHQQAKDYYASNQINFFADEARWGGDDTGMDMWDEQYLPPT